MFPNQCWNENRTGKPDYPGRMVDNPYLIALRQSCPSLGAIATVSKMATYPVCPLRVALSKKSTRIAWLLNISEG